MIGKNQDVEPVAALLSDAVATLHPAYRQRFEAMRVPLRKIPIDANPGETVVVVAEHEGRLLYWSDVEDGWEMDTPTASGGIHERGTSQFTLRQLMW